MNQATLLRSLVVAVPLAACDISSELVDDDLIVLERVDESRGETLTVDLSEATTGLLLGTLSRDGVELINIATLRGSMVDHERLEQPYDVVPDYLVHVRMTLPSGQIVYQGMQADLPTKGISQADWAMPEPAPDRHLEQVEEADPNLIALAAQQMADALDNGHFDAEQVVLSRIAEKLDSSAHRLELPLLSSPVTTALNCSGYGCDGKDPITYGCNGSAITPAFVDLGWLYDPNLFLRYSTGCETNWALFTSSAQSQTTVWVQRWAPSKSYSHASNTTTNRSAMVYCPDLVCLAQAKVTYEGNNYVTGYW